MTLSVLVTKSNMIFVIFFSNLYLSYENIITHINQPVQIDLNSKSKCLEYQKYTKYAYYHIVFVNQNETLKQKRRVTKPDT